MDLKNNFPKILVVPVFFKKYPMKSVNAVTAFVKLYKYGEFLKLEYNQSRRKFENINRFFYQ